MSRNCYVREAQGWAIGMLAAALAIALVALGIGGAIRLGHTDDHRICAKGHDVDPNNGSGHAYNPYFVCDEWLPAPEPSSAP